MKPRQYRLASLPLLDLPCRFFGKLQHFQFRRVALQLQALLTHTLREISGACVRNPKLDGPKPRRAHPLAVSIYLVSPLLDRGHVSLQRSEEHTSEFQSLMRISYAVFCLQKKQKKNTKTKHTHIK